MVGKRRGLSDLPALGAVGGAARIRTLREAHALLHLINFDEPFGLSVIEAMACGTAVIAMNRGSMPEIIDHGRTGGLVTSLDEAADAVTRVPEIDRREVSETIARRFSVDRMADDYIALYRRILNTDRAPPG